MAGASSLRLLFYPLPREIPSLAATATLLLLSRPSQMAFFPSPHSATLPNNLTPGVLKQPYRINRLSPSPPPQQPVNKRDKKRMAMADRLTEISNNFTENRDMHYRERLRSFHTDIACIKNAPLYDNKYLDDSGADLPEDLNPSAAGNTQGGVRTGQQPQFSGNGSIEVPATLGRHAAQFLQEVNDALEQKDADLVTASYKHNFAIDQLEKDYVYSVCVAEEEHKRLTDALRQRLIASVQARKVALQRDKEKLDIADTNALLYHPNQFSINSTASPGAPQSNRKTRHTRHRLEVDDLDTVNGANVKRKRKGLVDAENGSPVRESEPVNGYKALEARHEYQPVATPGYSVEKLFTEKELNMHLQSASYDVLEQLQTIKRRKVGVAPAIAPADLSEHEDELDAEPGYSIDGAEDVFLDAPAMERNATNQSYHATRSTRHLNIASGATRENLGELAGRQTAADMIGTYQREKKKDDDYNRAPALSDQEAAEDFALIAKAMKAEDQRRASDVSLLDEVAGERKDYINMPHISVDDTSRARDGEVS
ncbi:MAG: hypothetical protein Q9163_004297 [Psora crenata]